MEFWNSTLTEKSWRILLDLKKTIPHFVVIGGWAAYLWTNQHKSKDIDIIINFEDLQALKASVLFQQGKSMDKVLEELDNFRNNELKSTLTVETLKYLMKGGRVSRFRYAVGTLLHLTPCLEGTHDGKLEGFAAQRSYEDAIEKIIDRAYEDIVTKDNLAVYLTAGRAEKGVEYAQEYLKQKYPEIKILDTFELGSAIFTHTGPGTVVVLMFKYFEH